MAACGAVDVWPLEVYQVGWVIFSCSSRGGPTTDHILMGVPALAPLWIVYSYEYNPPSFLVTTVIAASTRRGSRHKVSASTSASTGVALTCSMTLIVAAKV